MENEKGVTVSSASEVALPSTSSSIQQQACSSRQFFCPICDFVNDKLAALETHIENEHFPSSEPKEDLCGEASLPSTSCDNETFLCPICNKKFKDPSQLESHVDELHISPPTKKRKTPSPFGHLEDNMEGASGLDLSCPVCICKGFSSPESLARHVEEHFDTGASEYGGFEDDEQLALRLEESARKEQEDFKNLQRLYGFDGDAGGMVQQNEQAMIQSVQRGEMSAVEYHEKRIVLKMTEKAGFDDGSSCTRDILPRLKTLLSNTQGVNRVNICSPMNHYAASLGDSGWGCGYRNFQMMLSSLLRQPRYVERFKRIWTSPTPDGLVQVPSVTRLQTCIEESWRQGFDPQGRDQLGGQLVGTKKWIGATEIAAVLGLCRIRYRLIDFHRPTSEDGKLHSALLSWVIEYFRSSAEFKAPLYFQHQGHSRTIVGIEQFGKSKTRLLVLDPSHKQGAMRMLLDESQLQPPVLKKIRIPLSRLDSKQYQIVCIDDGFVTDDREYLESRLLQSVRIPE